MSLNVNQIGYKPIFRGNVVAANGVTDPQAEAKQPEKAEQKEDKKGLSTGAWVGLGALATVAIGGLLIHHKINVNGVDKSLEKNQCLEDLFNNLKVNFNATRKANGGENLTVKEIFDKHLHSFDASSKTFYHGTGKEVAEKMQKEGMKKGTVGVLTGDWQGSYLAEDIKVAEKYAKSVAQNGKTTLGDTISGGAVVKTELPDGTKLAEFTDESGNAIHDILYRLFDDKNLEKSLQTKHLYQSDFIEFLQNKLAKDGYSGVRALDAHTGLTPIIFDGKIVKVSEIVNI